ncbi:MAG: hypothetical protein E7302_02085 [Butyrivibrio sp.]|nr:hypothetical protein [Butyrivibrio sp.]
MEEIYVGKKKNRISTYTGRLVKLVIVVGLLVLFFTGINEISSGNVDKQEKSLQTAIERDIVQCYSLEGIYPPSLEYLEDHYGLIYDKKLFFIDYRPIASNIYPEVTILRLDDR